MFNVHGLVPSTVPSKVPFINDLLAEKNQLFMGVTETWLHNHKDGELVIDGYKFFRSDRKRAKKSTRGRFSGGVGCYVRVDLAATMKSMVNFSYGVVELLGLYSKVKNLYLAVIYKQPDDRVGGHRSTDKEFQLALSKLKTSLSKLPDPAPNIIFCGDFNVRHALWPDVVASKQSSSEDKLLLKSLSDLANEHFLTQYITTPTHLENGVLDLVFSNNEQLVHSYSTIKPLRTTSDHFVIEMNTPLFCEEVSEEEKPSFASAFDNLNFQSNDIQWENMSSEIKTLLHTAEFDALPPNERLDRLLAVLIEIAYKYVPVRNTARKPTTYIPRHRRILMRKRRKLTEQMETTKSDARKTKIREKLVSIELLLQKSHTEARTRKERLAVKAIKNNSKFFFSYAKQYSTVRSKIGPLLDEKNEYTNSSFEMANILSKQYSSVFSLPCSSPYFEITEDTNIPTLTDVTFTEEDISDAIDELRNSAASGPDGLSAILLKNCKASLFRPLAGLWRDCLDQGITPTKLKEAHIIPIYKGGHQGLASNYRPVALTSHLIKIFEKVMRKNIVDFFQEHQLLNNSQHGFTIGRSCLSQLLAHYDEILNLVESGKNVDTVYLDFAKAFDKVDHAILLKKLSLLGVRGKVLTWLNSFLTSRTQQVMVNGVLSHAAEVKSGVPQGSVLGPLLFLVLISDIDVNVLTSFLPSFADDTRVSNIRVYLGCHASALQGDLEVIYQWAIDNNMSFNNSKFELIRRGLDSTLKLCTNYTSSDGSIIDDKDHVKDLGITMSSDCTFREHINKMCQSARNMCSWVLRTFKSRSSILMLTLWKSLVMPILDYCSQLWCPMLKGEIQQIEEIQKSFTRKIKMGDRGDYWNRLSSLRLYSLERRRERYRIIYVWKILEGLVPNLNKNPIRCTTSLRHGRMCAVPPTSNNVSTSLQSLRDGTLSIHGARLFNALPVQLRNMKGSPLPKFKEKLDNFLRTVPDEPQCCGYTANRRAASNSLLHMAAIA